MERLRNESTPGDARAAFRYFLDSPLANGLVRPVGFPKSANHVHYLPLYRSAPLQIELAAQAVRLEPEADRLCEAIKLVGELNSSILARDPAKTLRAFTDYRHHFGISLLVGFKAIGLHHTSETAQTGRKPYAAFVAPFLAPRRQVITVSFEDSIDRERDYLKVRRSFLGWARESRLLPGDAAAIIDQFSPLEDYGFDLGQRLQAYGRWSHLDAVAYLHRLPSLLERAGRSAEIEAVQEAIPKNVKTTWAETFAQIDIVALENALGLDEQYSDRITFAHLPAWSEYPQIFDYRLRIEAAVGPRLDGRFPVPRMEAAKFVPPCTTATELLATGPCEPSILQKAPKACGTFHRTIALIASLENGGVGSADEEQLCMLLDQTLDVPSMVSREELNAFLPRRPNEPLYEYLRTALLYDLERNKVANHALRRALQRLVAERFEGDIVKLLEHVDTPNGHVSTHLYHTCTEAFLTELYDLYKEADQVTEAQASMLEWRGERKGDEDAILRAKSHRLNLRLRKVRGTIEETRIYVDPLRFVEWVQQELGADLRVLSTQIDEILADPDTGLSLKDPVRTAVVPRLKLLKLLDQCYAEFCTNKIYGVTSFIGRRIRHGTLHGHLVLEFQPEVRRAIDEFKDCAPRFALFLEDWLERFETAVLQMAVDQIHVRSKDKPKGVIVATLDEADKSAVAGLMLGEIAGSIKESPQLLKSVALIREYCWLLFEVDAKRARRAVEALRREFVLNPGQQNYADRPDLERRIREQIRALNSAMAQRFEVVTSWFTRPTNLSPSASVRMLFEAVLDEVRQRSPGFAPTPTITMPEDVDLIGHRFHFFYDALYILVHNAARHAKSDGPLNISTSLKTDEKHTHLTVTVASVLNPDTAEESRAGIDEAMTGEIGDAMVNHGRSGIRKLRGLVDSVEEIAGLTQEYDEDSVIFTIKMRYPRS